MRTIIETAVVVVLIVVWIGADIYGQGLMATSVKWGGLFLGMLAAVALARRAK